MPKKFDCLLSKEELEKLYCKENLTIEQLLPIIGCKSKDTVAKILKENGIDTNNNKRISNKTKKGMTDEEFKSYLNNEYNIKYKSMIEISKNLGVSHPIVKKYLIKYGFRIRTKQEQQSSIYSSNWKGGKRKKKEGYIEIYYPTHPRANSRKCVYEHILVAERMIGRQLNDNEVVHHIDRNKSNNNPNNLLVLTRSEHAKLHIQAKEFRNNMKGV